MKYIDPTFTRAIAKEYHQTAKEKNACNILADQALHVSKRVIFAVQRGSMSDAKKLFAQATTLIKKMIAQPSAVHKGPVAGALEEYVESYITLLIAKGEHITAHPELSVSAETYIGALSDALGEIVRMATRASINKQIEELHRLHSVAQEIMDFLYALDITGHERQKFDQAKGHMRSLEHILYEVSLRHTQPSL